MLSTRCSPKWPLFCKSIVFLGGKTHICDFRAILEQQQIELKNQLKMGSKLLGSVFLGSHSTFCHFLVFCDDFSLQAISPLRNFRIWRQNWVHFAPFSAISSSFWQNWTSFFQFCKSVSWNLKKRNTNSKCEKAYHQVRQDLVVCSFRKTAGHIIPPPWGGGMISTYLVRQDQVGPYAPGPSGPGAYTHTITAPSGAVMV